MRADAPGRGRDHRALPGMLDPGGASRDQANRHAARRRVVQGAVTAIAQIAAEQHARCEISRSRHRQSETITRLGTRRGRDALREVGRVIGPGAHPIGLHVQQVGAIAGPIGQREARVLGGDDRHCPECPCADEMAPCGRSSGDSRVEDSAACDFGSWLRLIALRRGGGHCRSSRTPARSPVRAINADGVASVLIIRPRNLLLCRPSPSPKRRIAAVVAGNGRRVDKHRRVVSLELVGVREIFQHLEDHRYERVELFVTRESQVVRDWRTEYSAFGERLYGAGVVARLHRGLERELGVYREHVSSDRSVSVTRRADGRPGLREHPARAHQARIPQSRVRRAQLYSKRYIVPAASGGLRSRRGAAPAITSANTAGLRLISPISSETGVVAPGTASLA